MKIFKDSDIPFYWTGGFIHQAYVDLFDKCPGTFNCNDREDTMMYCALDGKHFSTKDKALLSCGYLLGLPFAVTIDAISIGSFPFRVVYRAGEQFF